MTADQIIERLESRSNAQSVEGMAKFGIRPARASGISIPTLRKLAREIGRDQALAVALWDSGIHEARMIAEPHLVSTELMEAWVKLRQIGKRNSNLHRLALDCAYEILNSDSKTARWVAKDALKELQAKEFKN